MPANSRWDLIRRLRVNTWIKYWSNITCTDCEWCLLTRWQSGFAQRYIWVTYGQLESLLRIVYFDWDLRCSHPPYLRLLDLRRSAHTPFVPRTNILNQARKFVLTILISSTCWITMKRSSLSTVLWKFWRKAFLKKLTKLSMSVSCLRDVDCLNLASGCWRALIIGMSSELKQLGKEYCWCLLAMRWFWRRKDICLARLHGLVSWNNLQRIVHPTCTVRHRRGWSIRPSYISWRSPSVDCNFFVRFHIFSCKFFVLWNMIFFGQNIGWKHSFHFSPCVYLKSVLTYAVWNNSAGLGIT